MNGQNPEGAGVANAASSPNDPLRGGLPPPPAAPRTAGVAIASLVLGILSWVLCLGVLTGIPAIILGAVGLKKIDAARGGLTGRGMAMAGLITGSLSFFLVFFQVALVLPAVSAARARAQEAACLNNVRVLCLACNAFADANEDRLPASLDELKPFVGGTLAQVLQCPRQRGSAEPSYELLEGGKKRQEIDDPARTVIVRERHPHPRGTRAMGFADGHVEMRTE